MLGYVTIGTNNLDLATNFYDELFSILGVKRVFEFERGVYYGRGVMEIGLLYPYDGQHATVGNGSMVAIQVDCQKEVNHLHAKALSLGAVSEGDPGFRGDPSVGFYGAYFRDLEGNKLCAYNLAQN